ncbi:MAG: hypothetical protein CR978_01335 [Gammaproteobacteria bacterium]|nr:MAG: hypothetical protein CR978_01335 [Gammaproteobacteria bacterium]
MTVARTGLWWSLACALALWAYWPGLAGPALLDDTQNIMVLDVLKEHPEFAYDMVFDNKSGPLGRPVSMATFVAEKIWLDRGVFGVKRINLVIHILCATLIYVLLNQWLGVTGWTYRKELALLGAVFWLFSPLFVSTVLYQVQRMAQLSTVFSLVALLLYGFWRNRYLSSKPHGILLLFILIFLILGVFSKENALLVVPLILVLEVFWYRGFDCERHGRALNLLRWQSGIFFGLLGAILLAFIFKPELLAGGYENRSFDVSQRLMTQSRVLWHYIAQFLWPNVQVLGVYHDDFPISYGLLKPVTTLLAVFSWVAFLVLALVSCWRISWRKYAFGLVFFLVAHLLESSTVGLEIYYEHRNYFPMIGVVVILLAFLGQSFQRVPEIAPPMLAFAILWLAITFFKLSSQASVWSNTDVLYMSAVNGHPYSLRANVEYGNALARKGYLEQALVYSRKADELQGTDGVGIRALREMATYCLARAAYPEEQMKKLRFDDKELRSGRFNQVFHFLIQKIGLQRCHESFGLLLANQVERVLNASSVSSEAQVNTRLLAAQLENALARYDKALAYTEGLINVPEFGAKALLMHLHFATAVQDREQIALAKQRLFALKAENKLDKHALYTLSLYTQGDETDTQVDVP